ncbi:hypothetical protein C5167_036787 [Papaver somniferum]|uniref:Uncharacterized protein n=1 Tax=Papaver somniferum TaxID=3469 RepID=A0A4Y7I7P7_PAPSO|nr:hypothetical protein C5167_036787 [Papaver somniferum]
MENGGNAQMENGGSVELKSRRRRLARVDLVLGLIHDKNQTTDLGGWFGGFYMGLDQSQTSVEFGVEVMTWRLLWLNEITDGFWELGISLVHSD